jgi:UDP-2-acetamido-2,6-beta-L-arabino-hexul-4-ose reductase
LPLQVNDRSTQIELLYIDDLIEEMLDILEGKGHYCDYKGLTPIPQENGKFCYVPITHKTTLGEIVDLLEMFKAQPKTLQVPQIPAGSLAKKLYSTYLSYLPAKKVKTSLTVHADARGSFTEIIKTFSGGQFSVNISKPGITKGNHWHNTKWEMFIVISGKARIEQRKIGSQEVIVSEVSGENPQVVYMLPGYTHNLVNLSSKEDLITLMWANESFDPGKPDTFAEEV